MNTTALQAKSAFLKQKNKAPGKDNKQGSTAKLSKWKSLKSAAATQVMEGKSVKDTAMSAMQTKIPDDGSIQSLAKQQAMAAATQVMEGKSVKEAMKDTAMSAIQTKIPDDGSIQSLAKQQAMAAATQVMEGKSVKEAMKDTAMSAVQTKIPNDGSIRSLAKQHEKIPNDGSSRSVALNTRVIDENATQNDLQPSVVPTPDSNPRTIVADAIQNQASEMLEAQQEALTNKATEALQAQQEALEGKAMDMAGDLMKGKKVSFKKAGSDVLKEQKKLLAFKKQAVNPANVLGGASKLNLGLMKDARRSMFIFRLQYYMYFAAGASVAIVLGYIFFKHMFFRRFRMPQVTHLVPLEPLNQDFSNEMATMIYAMIRPDLPNYDKTIADAFLGYTKIGNLGKAIPKLKAFVDSQAVLKGAADDDEFKDKLTAFVNTHFVWSRSAKLGDVEKNKELFDILQTIVDSREAFETYVETKSVVNFVDAAHMDNPKDNKTFTDYARFLDPPLKTRYDNIAKQHDSPPSDLSDEIAKFEGGAKVNPKAIADQLLEELKRGVFDKVPNASPEDMEGYVRYVQNSAQSKDACARDYSNSTYENLDPALKEAYDSITKLMVIYDALEKSEYEKLYSTIYFEVENYVYNSRVITAEGESQNVYTDARAYEVLRLYQTMLDQIYFLTNRKEIEVAVDFTLHYMLDSDEKKEERLDNVGNTYISLMNGMMYYERYRQRLVDYNRSRHPDPEFARKIYLKRLDTQRRFHINYMIFDQWMSLFKLKPPPAYKFTVHWIRNVLSIKKVIGLIMSGKEGFRDYGTDDDVIEGFKLKGITKGITGGFKKVMGGAMNVLLKPLNSILDIVKAIPQGIMKFFNLIKDFFKSIGSIVQGFVKLITNPLSLIEFFARLVILIAFLPVVILYNIPIKGVMLAEFFVYPWVLLYFSVWNLILLAIFAALTLIFGLGVDVNLFRGRLYPIFYRYFIAVENKPSAWYEVGGYHARNRNERLLLAMRECGTNYVPDDQTGRLTCVRKMEGEPKFCPQANIYRVFRNMSMKTPYKPREFIPDAKFMEMKPSARRKLIADYKKMKLKFYRDCDKKMQFFDSTTKSICRSIDTLDLSESQKRNLRGLCFDTYCRNGRRERFCHAMTPTALSNIPQPVSLFGRTMFLSTSVLILAYFVTTMLRDQAPSIEE